MLENRKLKILYIFVTAVCSIAIVYSQETLSTDNLVKDSNVSKPTLPVAIETSTLIDISLTSSIETPLIELNSGNTKNETSRAAHIEFNKDVATEKNHMRSNVGRLLPSIEQITTSTETIKLFTKTESITLPQAGQKFNNVSSSLARDFPQQNSTARPTSDYNDSNNTAHSENEDMQHYDNIVLSDKPEDCKEGILPQQPINMGTSILRKCCPVGESIYDGENGKPEYCDSSDKVFNPKIIEATLYRDCIKDNEREVDLEIEAGNPCNVSLIYGKAYGDALYVLQNGSLLITDKNGKKSYDIKNDYCLDSHYKTGDLFAVVCVAPVESHLGRGQTILFAIFMIASIPCLMLVSFFHFSIRRLRTMHGLCLGFLSSCLAMGFLLHSIAQLSETSKSKVGYAVQYFMLSYFLWLLMLCCNVVVIVWYYLPRYIRLSRKSRYSHFITYSILALSIPLCIVLYTRSKGIPGMPSYFFQAWSESIQSSQRYFIPPVSTILILCFILLIVAYFGFRKLDSLVETRSLLRHRALNSNGKDDTGLPVIDLAMLEETKQDAKCITYLAIIVLTTWIMEVFTFYSPGSDDYLAFMEIINGLQGVFILIFFIGVRHRRHIIVRWWHDRGSLGIKEVEMENLKQTDT